MATFPSITAPSYGSEPTVYLPKTKVEFGGGYVDVGSEFTNERRKWQLVWDALPESEYQTLEAFFIAQGGEAFDWTEPVTSTAYSVFFSDDELKAPWKENEDGYRSVTLNIEEVG